MVKTTRELRVRGKLGERGKRYWIIDFAVEIYLARTSICADMTWFDKVIEQKYAEWWR